MHSINRRDVIAGAGAAAGASLVALPAVAAGDPDAGLKALLAELEPEAARMERAERAQYRKLDEVDAALPPKPPHPSDWETPEMPRRLHDLYMEATRKVPISELLKGEWYPEPVRKWYADMDAEKARITAAWEEWRDVRNKLYEERGFNTASDVYDAHYEAASALARRIFATPAHSLEGIAVKLRAADLLHFDMPEDEPEACIIDDIRRVTS